MDHADAELEISIESIYDHTRRPDADTLISVMFTRILYRLAWCAVSVRYQVERLVTFPRAAVSVATEIASQMVVPAG